jgi:hypothetical protein
VGVIHAPLSPLFLREAVIFELPLKMQYFKGKSKKSGKLFLILAEVI